MAYRTTCNWFIHVGPDARDISWRCGVSFISWVQLTVSLCISLYTTNTGYIGCCRSRNGPGCVTAEPLQTKWKRRSSHLNICLTSRIRLGSCESHEVIHAKTVQSWLSGESQIQSWSNYTQSKRERERSTSTQKSNSAAVSGSCGSVVSSLAFVPSSIPGWKLVFPSPS